LIRKRLRIIVGLLLAALGIILWCFSVGWISGDVELYWPIVVVALGGSRAVEEGGIRGGLLVVTVGAVVQLSNLGLFVLQPRAIVRYWPLILVAVAAEELRPDGREIDWVNAVALASIGVWLQLSYFGAEHMATRSWWPLIIAVSGLWGLLRPRLLPEEKTS
jgi:hypothetical protein